MADGAQRFRAAIEQLQVAYIECITSARACAKDAAKLRSDLESEEGAERDFLTEAAEHKAAIERLGGIVKEPE